MNHRVMYLKLTQHCKSTILKKKKVFLGWEEQILEALRDALQPAAGEWPGTVNDLPWMAERSRSDKAVSCPSSKVDCRLPLSSPLPSMGPKENSQESAQLARCGSLEAGNFLCNTTSFQKLSFLQRSSREGWKTFGNSHPPTWIYFKVELEKRGSL